MNKPLLSLLVVLGGQALAAKAQGIECPTDDVVTVLLAREKAIFSDPDFISGSEKINDRSRAVLARHKLMLSSAYEEKKGNDQALLQIQQQYGVVDELSQDVESEMQSVRIVSSEILSQPISDIPDQKFVSLIVAFMARMKLIKWTLITEKYGSERERSEDASQSLSSLEKLLETVGDGTYRRDERGVYETPSLHHSLHAIVTQVTSELGQYKKVDWKSPHASDWIYSYGSVVYKTDFPAKILRCYLNRDALARRAR